jgi:hypothetical protein
LGILITGMMIALDSMDISIYIDPPSFYILLVPVLLLLKSQFSWADMGEAFAIGFSRKPVEKARLKKALLFFTVLQKYLMWTGLIGLMLGIIAMFSSFSDYIAVGRGLAVALLVVFYALILTLTIALPFQYGLKKKITEAGDSGEILK